MLLAVWTFLCCVAAGALTLARPLSRRWRWRVERSLFQGVAALIGMAVESRGPRPSPPFLLVSNHLSYLDVVVYGSQVGCRFVAKAEVRSWPLLGSLARAGGTIFIDRAAKRDLPRAMREIRRALDEGDGVLLFAEGTSGSGDRVLPFRPGLLEVAARDRLPVLHACVRYSTPSGGPPVSQSIYGREISFGRHLLRVLRLRTFNAEVEFSDSALFDTDRKRLAGRLHQVTAERFRALQSRESPA